MAMASSASPSTLTLSSFLTQELNPTTPYTSISVKSNPLFFTNSTNAFSLFPLVLKLRERKSSIRLWNGADGSFSKSFMVAAVAAEAELADAEEQEEGEGEGGVSVAAPPVKPKKGKAALPLKRDRMRSKRFLEIQNLRENKKEYYLETGISLLKQTAKTKFVESAEAHFRLNIDPKYNDQQLRATVNLPKGTGQTVKVAVLTQGYPKKLGTRSAFDDLIQRK